MDITIKICLVVIGVLILLVIKSVYDQRSYDKRIRMKLHMEWGTRSEKEYTPEMLDAIAYYFQQKMQSGDIDDITWNDLDMDRVYQQINQTKSAFGQEYLYALLRKPQVSVEELEERERLIHFFQTQEEERMALQSKFAKMGPYSRSSVYQYLEHVKNLKQQSNLPHMIQMVALLVSIGFCLVKPGVSIVAASCIAAYNMVTYYRRKGEMDQYYRLFSYIVKTVHFCEEISALPIEEIATYRNALKENAKLFCSFCRGSRLVVGGADMDGSLVDSMMDYVRMLFHIDIMKFQSMAKEVIRLEPKLVDIFEVVGYLDSMLSVASYRQLMEVYCIPEFVTEKEDSGISTEKIYHPLLTNPVKNSIVAGKPVLLTGSNASGKSTFLKTIAINALLAQTIHTVMADYYQGGLYQIYSSMALRDDLAQSESYYIVEIKSLKRIMDRVQRKEERRVLCFIDEVLRGTNTLERIASSSQILYALAQERALCFAATHDIELTDMLSEVYDNYHFEEQVEEDQVEFDYQLKQGKAMSRNAIKLLGMIGYDSDIIGKAEDSVNTFLKQGIWSVQK